MNYQKVFDNAMELEFSYSDGFYSKDVRGHILKVDELANRYQGRVKRITRYGFWVEAVFMGGLIDKYIPWSKVVITREVY